MEKATNAYAAASERLKAATEALDQMEAMTGRSSGNTEMQKK